MVWAAEGRSGEVLARFAEIGPERCAAIELVTMDMAAGYRRAVESCLPQAEIVYDRFHVQRLASDAVDRVRRAIVRELTAEEAEAARAIKNSRYAQLKNPWNLEPTEPDKLSTIQATNQPLYRAYLLKEALADALDYRRWRARDAHSRIGSPGPRALDSNRSSVSLAPFARTSTESSPTSETRLTNGFTEGTNNKLRLVARRALGFHSPQPLIAMLFLT